MASTNRLRVTSAQRGTTLPRIGGVLAIAGTFIGVGIFILGCFGFSAAFYLSPIPLLLDAIGLVLTFCGMFYKNIAVEDPHVVAALLVNAGAVIAGGLLELAIMMNVPIFYQVSFRAKTVRLVRCFESGRLSPHLAPPIPGWLCRN